MKSRFSIRKKLLFGVLCSCIIPYVLGGFYIKHATEDWLFHNYIDHSSMMLEATAKHVDDAILDLMANLTTMMSMDQRVIASRGDLRNYTEFTLGTPVRPLTNTEIEVSAYLETIKSSQPPPYVRMVVVE